MGEPVHTTMRIVFSSDWYSEGLGYAENVLPAVLARRGHDVFMVTSTMQVYGDHDFYGDTHERFLGPPVVEPGTTTVDGVTVIRLPVRLWWKRLRVARGRNRTIRALRPDVVFAWDPRSYQTLMLSLASVSGGYALFSSVHTVASVYPAYYSYAEMSWQKRLYLRLTDTLVGWIAGRHIRVCYGSTPDAEEIAARFFGIRRSTIKGLPTGLDTHRFHPPTGPGERQRRVDLRARLGLAADDLLCVYTGRMTEAKNPYCLAEAVRFLRAKGISARGFFIGDGEQATRIAGLEGCTVESFMIVDKLADYYRAADVGVWPRQESISMIDAAACGLPIVVSDRMRDTDRVEGNGLTYRENDAQDLATVLERLTDPDLRARLGARGAEKMASRFGVDLIADALVADFEAALAGNSSAGVVAASGSRG